MPENLCVHCGEDCGKYPVVWNNKNFCCHGCESVYQILNENKLYKYYEIAPEPGIKLDQNDFGGKYAYLDNIEIKEKLLEFSDGEISKVTFYIPSIHCSSCIWLLENLNTLNQNIVQSMVNFVKKEVTINFRENNISLRQVVELLVSIHYVPHITLEQFDRKKADKTNKQIIYKIGIAGFAFGNIMLLSIPQYLPGKEFIEEPFQNFFGWLTLILSLPVLLYCSNDYIISAYKNLRHKIINIDLPIAIGIFALFIQSSYEVITQNGGGYFDSLSGLVFFLLIGKWFQSKTYKALSFDRDYKSYFPVAVTKIENGKEINIQLSDLKIKDHILIRNQELIPADALLIEGKALIDYSFVTGESRPVERLPGNELYAGGKQIGSSIILEIGKEVEQSQLTKLWNQENLKNKEKSNLITLIDKVSQYFTAIIISIAVSTALFWFFKDPSIAIRAATSVLIIACPCALALSLPFTFGNMMRLLGKKGFFIKKAEVIEKLTKFDTIVFDKTGTITKSGNEKIDFEGQDLTEEEQLMIFSITKHSTHPLSFSIYNYLKMNKSYPVEDFMEIPSSGLKGKINDHLVKIGSSEFVNNGQIKETDAPNSKVFVSIDDKFIGHFNISNEYRENLDEIIETLDKKYELHLISGDNDSEKTNLAKIFNEESNLHFNFSPDDKYQYIKTLSSQNKNILMIGDGLNDAGALRESDVGISIADDVYQFSPACDAILEASKFKYLVELISLSNKSLKIIKISFAISFLYNIIGLFFAIHGILSPIIAALLMPISSISVVVYATFATSFVFKKSSFSKSII